MTLAFSNYYVSLLVLEPREECYLDARYCEEFLQEIMKVRLD